MLTSVPQSDCTGARAAASARLDGELSELEGAHLDAHLSECAACHSYAEGIEAITTSLRAASLAQPQSRILLPRRRRLPLVTAAASFALLAAAGGSLLGLDRARSQEQPGLTATTHVQAVLTRDFTQKDLLAMLDRYELQPPQHPGGLRAI